MPSSNYDDIYSVSGPYDRLNETSPSSPQDGQLPVQEAGRIPSQPAQPAFSQQAQVAPHSTARMSTGKGWIAGIVIVAIICLTTIFGIVSCSSLVDDSLSSLGIKQSEPSYAAHGPSIAVIDLDSTIQYDGSPCSPEGFKALLDRASDDDNVKGVILRVNSGGGTSTAGEEMAIYLAEFDKPCVVSSAATNASAAYEISSQADYIFVDKTTFIGSIGVILQIQDLSGLYEKLGISIESIASDDSKDSTYGNRPLTEEERQWYQHMVDQVNEEFIKRVAVGRHMSIEDVTELANGLPYTGMDAVDNGLADEIGTFEDALDYISDLCGYDHQLDTIGYGASARELYSLLDILGMSAKDNSTDQALDALYERYGQMN